ncbi:MAG: fibronectin type III domain-containing protein, partial [Patescibacteria group bacterium]
YYIYLKATDKFGHTTTLLLQRVVTSDAPPPPILTVKGMEGATMDLSWTATDSATFTRYEVCYGQSSSRVTGSTCQSTGNPSGAVLKTFTPKTITSTTLTGLKENTRYYVKIWLRDSKWGVIAGNSTSAVTCRAGQRWAKGVCTTIATPLLKLVGIEGATVDLSWTAYDSKTVTGYDMCYGQTASRVTGTSCLSTGSPSGAKLVQVSAATLSRTLTDLTEKTLYYAKVWVRDSIHGTKAGTNISFTTCGAGETLIKGKCTALPACSDGLDNDGDGNIDYPADAGCENATDTNETDPAPEATPTPEPTPEAAAEPPPPPPPVVASVVENISEGISNAVESFVEFVEETFGEQAAEVVKTVVAVAKKVVETTVRVVKAVAAVVPTQPAVVIPVAAAAAVAVAASTGLVTVVPNFAGELFYLWQRLMQGLLGLAGARKRYPWGRVVDA